MKKILLIAVFIALATITLVSLYASYGESGGNNLKSMKYQMESTNEVFTWNGLATPCTNNYFDKGPINKRFNFNHKKY